MWERMGRRTAMAAASGGRTSSELRTLACITISRIRSLKETYGSSWRSDARLRECVHKSCGRPELRTFARPRHVETIETAAAYHPVFRQNPYTFIRPVAST